MDKVAAWGLQGWPWIASHPIAYPALEVLHITGIALLLGSLVLLAAVVARKWRRGAPWASPAMGLQVALAGLFAACGLRRVLSGAKWLDTIYVGDQPNGTAVRGTTTGCADSRSSRNFCGV